MIEVKVTPTEDKDHKNVHFKFRSEDSEIIRHEVARMERSEIRNLIEILDNAI